MKQFKDLPIGTVFQWRDGRVSESTTWAVAIKISKNSFSYLSQKPSICLDDGDESMAVTDHNMRGLIKSTRKRLVLTHNVRARLILPPISKGI